MASANPLSIASAESSSNPPGSTILYSYWRSSCSWRVRIALYFKGIPFEYRAINLLRDEQASTSYTEINPGKVVPTLIIDNQVLVQSIAILEYLEERVPKSWRLLPVEPHLRAQVRAVVQMIASDIQPVQNLRVLRRIEDEEKRKAHACQLIASGLEAVERYLGKTSGTCCVGNDVTLADVCLVPQVYNARRFGVQVDRLFPIITRIDQHLSGLEPFQLAHPNIQPDAP